MLAPGQKGHEHRPIQHTMGPWTVGTRSSGYDRAYLHVRLLLLTLNCAGSIVSERKEIRAEVAKFDSEVAKQK
jgi:hypothetical protein